MKIKLSKSQWQEMGKIAGWAKQSNFYDFVQEKFPPVTPAQATEELRIKLLEEDHSTEQQRNKELSKNLSLQLENNDKITELLRDIRGFLSWNVLIFNPDKVEKGLQLKAPYSTIDDIIEEINKHLKLIRR